MSYKRNIISTLVDWYEGSPAYTRSEPPPRRRTMKFYGSGKTDFPEYDIENHIARKDINNAVLELADAGIIGYSWLPGQENHIISGVWLCAENLDKAYALLKRAPKHHEADEAIAGLERLLSVSTQQWIVEWAREKHNKISKKRSIGNLLPPDAAERLDLFKALEYLGEVMGTETEMPLRVFSLRCYGDTKRFENTVKARLTRIIKKHLAVEDDCTDDNALRLVGLVRYPELFEFAGALTLNLPGGAVDYSPLPYGGVMSSDDVRTGSFTFGPDIRHVLTIENKANFISYIHKERRPHELAIYHGGQYSPAKREFLKKIIEAMPPGASFSHWGDIDFGGFSMLARLRRDIFPHVTPHLMSATELERYRELCISFNDKYTGRLATLLMLPELGDCVECIEYMLRNRLRLEQEAMLIY